MDSRLVIRAIKVLTSTIQTNPADDTINSKIERVSNDLTNPYLLCFRELFDVAKINNIDVSSIYRKISELKHESSATR